RGLYAQTARPRLLHVEPQAHALVWLQAQHQLVRRAGAHAKDRHRRIFELHHYLRAPCTHALSSAQIERHTSPTPIVDFSLDCYERLRTRWLADLFSVCGRLGAVDEARLVLPADGL